VHEPDVAKSVAATFTNVAVGGGPGAGGSVIDTVSGTVMLAITSAGVLSTTLLKPELAAAVLMAAIMLFAKAGLVDAADRLSATASQDAPHATT